MRPAAFTYSRPANLADALRALAAGAVPLAGGQSLLQAMRLRAATPRAIVDLAGVAELSDAMTVDGESITIGARVTHAALLEHAFVSDELPWLRAAAHSLGDVQVRNLGTVLGNVCWADPRANMAVALLASDALVTAVAPSHGETVDRIALGDFFTGFRSHALNGRLATSIELPHPRGARGAYLEFSRQRQDLALVNVCVVRGAGHARVAVGGIDPMPVRLPEVEAAIVDGDGADVVHALHENLVRGRHAPPVDHHGPDEYKLGLAVTLVKRALALCEASP
jgi:carbon-monoxide dehydrogenase medium subunit